MQLLCVSQEPNPTPHDHAPEAGATTEPRAAELSPFLPEEALHRGRLPRYTWILLAILVALGVMCVWVTARGSGGLAALALYSIPSNTAISLLPHEPMLLIYGARENVWLAALAATGGTAMAGWIDHRIFVPVLSVERTSSYKETRLYRWVMDLFVRAPFAALVIAGVTPVPFFPFKVLAFSGGYAIRRYVAAVAIGRFPRYLLILWFGAAFRIPAWLLVAATLLAFSAYGVQLLARRFGRSRPPSPR